MKMRKGRIVGQGRNWEGMMTGSTEKKGYVLIDA
jgi:hypothetical protein